VREWLKKKGHVPVCGFVRVDRVPESEAMINYPFNYFFLSCSTTQTRRMCRTRSAMGTIILVIVKLNIPHLIPVPTSGTRLRLLAAVLVASPGRCHKTWNGLIETQGTGGCGHLLAVVRQKGTCAQMVAPCLLVVNERVYHSQSESPHLAPARLE